MRRSKHRFWYDDKQTRGRFEKGVRNAYPNANITPGFRGHEARYKMTVDIPEFEPREIEIVVPGDQTEPRDVMVLSDSTSKLKHTFGPIEGSPDPRERLCIWYPSDPEERTWAWEDGLLSLITLARIHLYKEAYFAKHGEWLGDEAPHEPKNDPDEGEG